jgi:hypothetical protein
MYGIVANVLSDKVLRTGAKVWILYCNGDAEHPRVMGLSKSGRTVRKYTAHKRLEKFRAKWIPEHLREEIGWQWEDRAKADELAKALAEMWQGIRFYKRDGTLLRDGEPTSTAFKRASRRATAT